MGCRSWRRVGFRGEATSPAVCRGVARRAVAVAVGVAVDVFVEVGVALGVPHAAPKTSENALAEPVSAAALSLMLITQLPFAFWPSNALSGLFGAN